MGVDAEPVWNALNGQIYLGDERFVAQTQRWLAGGQRDNQQIPKPQRQEPPLTLEQIRRDAAGRDEAIVAAYATGAYSYAEIGECFGLHFTAVGTIVRKARRQESQG